MPTTSSALILFGTVAFIATLGGSERCGSHPSVVFLKRGERSRIDYWADEESPEFRMNSVVALPEVHPALVGKTASGRSETQAEFPQSERQFRTDLSLEEDTEIPEFRTEEVADTTVLPAEADELGKEPEAATFRAEYEDEPEFRAEEIEMTTAEPEVEPEAAEGTIFRPEFVDEAEVLSELQEIESKFIRTEEPEARTELGDQPEAEESSTMKEEQPEEPELLPEFLNRFEPEELEESSALPESPEFRTEMTEESSTLPDFRTARPEEDDPLWTTPSLESRDDPEFRTEEPEATEDPEPRTELPDAEFHPQNEDLLLWTTSIPEEPEFRTEVHPAVQLGSNPTTVPLRPEVKPEMRLETNPEVKSTTDTTIAAEPEVGLEVQPEVQPEVKSIQDGIAATTRPEVNFDVKPDVQSRNRPEVEATTRPEVTSFVKPEVDATTRPEVKQDVTSGSKRPEVDAEMDDVLVNRIHSIVESVASRRPSIMQKTSGFIHSVFRRPRERRQIVQVVAPDLSSGAAGSWPSLAPEDDSIWRNFMLNRKVPPSGDQLAPTSGFHVLPESGIAEFEDFVGMKNPNPAASGAGGHLQVEVSGSLPPYRKQNNRKKPGKSGSGGRFRNSLVRFIESQPLPLKRALLDPHFRRPLPERRRRHVNDRISAGLADPCDLHIKTEDELHLLVTFHNLSAPYTVDCSGAYIEIERESNGFHARWCGSPIAAQQRGIRSHVIFARSHLRISVFSQPPEVQPEVQQEVQPEVELQRTGFTADIEVVDLRRADADPHQRSGAYSSVQRSVG